MLSIAIALSGETRNYNEQNGPDSIINFLRSRGHLVHLYGHTWDHCEVPNNSSMFKHLSVESQSTIDSWIKEDFMLRAWSNRAFNPTCKLIDMSSEEFVKRILAESRAKYGQHFSGLKSIYSVPKNIYDIIIRWRWDLTISPYYLNSIDLMNIFHTRLEWLNQKNLENFNVIQCSSNSWANAYGYAIEDTNFYINKHAHTNLLKMNISDRFDRVFLKLSGNEKCSYHTLWTELLTQTTENELAFELPNITCFTSERLHPPNKLSS